MFKALKITLPAAGMMLLAAAPARAADEPQVKASIDRAIAFLKRSISNAGQGIGGGQLDGGGGFQEGPAALAGIALLEAGVKLDDPVIQSIAQTVRRAAISQHLTYQLSLDIIFLDKLGEPADILLLQSMGARLLLGQNGTGGWGYGCPQITREEQQRLSTALDGAVLKGGKDLPTAGSQPANRAKLDDGVRDMLQRGSGIVPPAEGGYGKSDDNSNTQFAVVALWSARKYGLPVERAFKAIENRFRQSQLADGGWPYLVNAGLRGPAAASTPSMTCAGLIGLGAAAGERGERTMRGGGRIQIGADNKIKGGAAAAAPRAEMPDMTKDPSVKAALDLLGKFINSNNPGQPAGPGAAGPMRPGGAGAAGAFPGAPPGGGAGFPLPGGPQMLGGGGPGGFGPPGGRADLRADLYFLWSLERVCMVYNLPKIGGKDWHAWGAEWLLQNQRNDGSWFGRAGHQTNDQVDTAFGLMFMCRSNLVRDLSKLLERSVKGGGAALPNAPASAAKPVDSEATAMAKALVSAAVDKQLSIIKDYSEGKGGKYSLALAEAIPKLGSDIQKAARDALAERMGGLKAKTLRDYMQADDPELRRAAVLGAAMTDDTAAPTLIPDLIERLDDVNELVWRAAAISLRELTGQNYGPKKGASDADRNKAIAQWRAWYDKNKPKEGAPDKPKG